MLTNKNLNEQVAEKVITRFAMRRDTDTLSQLVAERHHCLRQLAELGSWQAKQCVCTT